MSGHTPDHDRGLAFDLATLNRRRVLALFGGAGLATLVGCAAPSTATSPSSATSSSSASSATAAAGAVAEIPDETAGPYPGDGSNGPNILTESGIVRSDIRSSFGSSSGTAQGVPLTVTLSVQDGGKALAGAAVYLWHCDREGRYSMYSSGAENENYLRGVQEADDDGVVEFTSIFPACYSGRWPHIHFEIYESLAAASDSQNQVKTSQLALPEGTCDEVFATSGYEASVTNFSRITLASDNVFSDGVTLQLCSITGDIESGFVATLDVAIPI